MLSPAERLHKVEQLREMFNTLSDADKIEFYECVLGAISTGIEDAKRLASAALGVPC